MRVLEVNVVGVLATSQAFLPLLRAGKYKGHIVNLGSVVSLPALIAPAFDGIIMC
jgi:NAD(P)-dependent dehydrogenase (short-subunit alcohol dehydrogenase family)